MAGGSTFLEELAFQHGLPHIRLRCDEALHFCPEESRVTIMPKSKETTAPIKGEKPRKAPKLSETARKKPAKSEEIVVESDSEGSRTSSSSGHSSGSESDFERRKNTKKPNMSKVAETEPADPPIPDSTSDDEDSSEDESDGQNHKRVPQTGPKTNGNAKSRKDSDESSEVSDSSEEEALTSRSKKDSNSHMAAFRRPTEYNPPPGYSTFDIKNGSNSVISKFKPADLASKEIWHITAPVGLSLAEVKSLALGNVDGKQAVCTHNGMDYGIAEEKQATGASNLLGNKHILIPSEGGKGYGTVKTTVAKTLHFQRIINLPNLSKRQANPTTGSNAAAEAGQQQVRGPKPQPKGLKMRYKPPGFGSGQPGAIGSDSSEEDEDVEMTDAAPVQNILKDDSLKRKASQTTKTSNKTPKSDKTRKDKDQPITSKQPESHSNNGEDAATKALKSLVEGTKAELPVTQEEEARLAEEKAQRKEERRVRRERKATRQLSAA